MRKLTLSITMMFAITLFSQTYTNTSFIYELSGNNMEALLDADISLYSEHDFNMKLVIHNNTIDLVSAGQLYSLIITNNKVIENMLLYTAERKDNKKIYMILIQTNTINIFEGGDPVNCYKFNYKTE